MMYRFGACTFETTRAEIRRAGCVIKTEPQVLKVLRYLLEHRDRVVSRDELLAQCWPETYISDAALTSCLRRVREAIGQSREGPLLIQTLHRQGYRFVGEVREVSESVAPERPALRSLTAEILPPPPALDERLSEPSPEPDTSPALLRSAVPAAPPIPATAAGADAPASPLAPQPVPSESAAITERRHLTVLSCTLAEAATLGQQLDPEDHYELLQRFRATCEEMVVRYEGHVAQQFDDGVLVYFGYPQAYEDAARRAVHSALALTQAMRDGALDTWALSGTPLAVHVGIATGMMIVRARDNLVAALPALGVGSASSLAVRLGAVAAPGTVVISEATARLVRGYFTCKALEDVTLAGAASQVVYEVRGAHAFQSRLEVESVYGLTPFVGREAEVALFAECWAYIQEGLGQVVLVRGEAGMGKSRLVQVWQEQVGDALALAWACRCSPHHQHTALYPLVELLQRVLYEASSPSPASQLESLEALLGQYGFALAETVPLLADLVALPLPAGRYGPLNLTPPPQRERTLETLVSLLVAQATVSPVLLVVEDLHWADPSMLDFLELLMQQVATIPLLLVLTCRPAFTVPWEQRSTLTPVVLHRLTRGQTEQMIQQVAAGKRLPAEVVQQMVEKTDGVPLFVEELTRMVVESGELVEREGEYELRGELSALTVPLTLRDSLMARLDRLGVGKDLAQWGSVVGREFSYAVLQAVTLYDEGTLQGGLRELVDSALVFQRGLLPQSWYRFKHALIQDAAYDSLPRRRRQAMHGQLAQVLERQFPSLVETQPEMLAHHYTQAGLTEPAIVYWYQAGQQAIQGSAHVEAIAHLTQGLALLTTRPETPARWQQELDFQVALGPALIVTKGEGAVEVERTYARARELCQQVGDTPQLFQVLRGLVLYYLNQVDLQTAHQLAEELLRLGHFQADPAPRMLAHHLLGIVLFYWGEPVAAHTHHLQVLSLYTPREPRAFALRYGLDLGVGSHNFLAWELWHLGYPDQAMQHNQAAHTLAQEISHPYSLCLVLVNAARVYQHRRETLAVLDQTEALTTLATEQGFAQWLTVSTILHGWALAMQGQGQVGIDEMRQGLAAHLGTSAKSTQPYYLGLLAEAYGANGHPEAGLEVLAEALAVMDTTEMRFYAAELYRLKGVLLLQQAVPDAQQAEACFHQALDIARQQEAKSWELRAATSQAHLWQQQGKRQAAYDLLAPIVHWFTEGFNTADVQEATSLLAVLG